MKPKSPTRDTLPKWFFYGLLTAMPLALTPWSQDAALYSKFMVTAAICIIVLFRFGLTKKKHFPRIHTPTFHYPALLFLLIQGLCIIHSPFPSEGLWVFFMRLLPFVVGYCLVVTTSEIDKTAHNTGRALSLALFLQCCIGFGQYFNLGMGFIPSSELKPSGSFLNKNLLASWIFITLPFVAWFASSSRGAWSVLAKISIAGSASLLIFTYSRLAWIWIFLFSGFLLIQGIHKARATNFKGFIPFSCLVAGILFAVIVELSWDPSHLVYRLDPRYTNFAANLYTLEINHYANRERVKLWAGTLEEIGSHPVRGLGTGGWKWARPFFEEDLINTQPDRMAASPHNEFLLIGAETGLIGVAMAILLLALIFKNIFNKQNFSFLKPQMKGWLAFSLGGFVLSSLVSYPADRVEHLSMLGFFSGLSFLGNKKSQNTLGNAKQPIIIAILILLCTGFVIAAVRWKSEVHYKNYDKLKKSGNLTEAYREITQTDGVLYRVDRTGTPIAYHKAMLLSKMGHDSAAIGTLLRGESIHPNHPHLLNNLGVMFIHSGKTPEGIARLERVIHINPYFMEARMNLAAGYYNQKQYTNALKVLKSSPSGVIDKKSRTMLNTIKSALHDARNTQGD